MAAQALEMFEAAGLPCPVHRNPTDHFLHAINEDFQTEDKKDNMVKLVGQYDSSLKPHVEQVCGSAEGSNRGAARTEASIIPFPHLLASHSIMLLWRCRSQPFSLLLFSAEGA